MAPLSRITMRAFAAVAGLFGAFALGACGGGERQDAGEPSGTFPVSVEASFPSSQRLAEPSRLVIAVTNTGQQAVPDVAVTVDGFASRSEQPALAARNRPVWIVDDGPRGGGTAYANTWALGRLEAGSTRRFTWRVNAVRSGRHMLRWKVAAGLGGRAQARVEGDSTPSGQFSVAISDAAPDSHVDPATGDVVRDGP